MVNIRVSATSANIGAGFDCMGLALNLYNEIEVDTCEKQKLIIETDDSGIPRDETNLVYSSMKSVFDLCGKTPSVRIKQINNIPSASGLGSSAACVVAGVFAANAFLGGPLKERELINLCCKLDTHPDNVLPAIVGGVAAGVMTDSGTEYIRCDADGRLTLYAATPSFPLLTTLSRKVLPDAYSRGDVVYSLSRAIVTFAAFLKGDLSMLKIIGDKIHEPYRAPLIKGYGEIKEIFSHKSALASYLSGAGPTVIGLFDKESEFTLPSGWTLRKLKVDNSGVLVTKRQKT